MRLPAIIATGVSVLAIATLAGCGTSGDASSTAATAPQAQSSVTRQASVVSTIASGAYAAYGKWKACLANREVGQPCLASDSQNIREIIKQVKGLSEQIDRNQAQALAEFDRVTKLLLAENITQRAAEIRGIQTNGNLAMRAYQALLACLETTAATCQPYIGGTGLEPAEPVQEAVARTQRYMLQKVKALPADIDTAAEVFTGTAQRSGGDGLADAIWRFNKQAQDTAAGITDSAVKASDTVPVASKALANAQSQDIGYWSDVFTQYGYLRVVSEGLKAGQGGVTPADADRDARSAQATVDRAIAGGGRYEVAGSVAAYDLPELRGDGQALVGDGKTAWIVSQDAVNPKPAGTRALGPNDVRDLARLVSTYMPVQSFRQKFDAQASQWYRVRQPVKSASYTNVKLRIELGPISDPDVFNWVIPSQDVKWLAGPESSESCVVFMRAMNERPKWPLGRTGGFAYGPDSSKPAMPADALKTTWDTLAPGPVDYMWDERFDPKSAKAYLKAANVGLGWGGWVLCGKSGIATIPSEYVPVTPVPIVLGPAK